MELESDERYDRQIRLWGQHGQSKFSKSKVCLINCDSLGLEILKGLCLAGIGSCTIMDSHRLTAEDIGSSFLPPASIGKSRGESARSMLLDINNEVCSEVFPLETYLPHVTTQPQSNLDPRVEEDDSINKDLELWKQFNCVIVCGTLYTGQIRRLSKLCWSLNTPLILCKSIGFYGSLRIQIKEHNVLDTHPEWRPANHDPNKPDTLTIHGAKSIRDEYDGNVYSYVEEDNEDDSIAIYVCMKALDLFFSTYGRLPGLRDDQVEADVSKLKDCVKQMFGKSTSQLKTLDQCLYELCRYGGAEIHSTSAFMGGCAAQEVIKLVTHQYVPLDDTLVYNAMSATTRSFKFNELFTTL
jgi:molybdopterin/thiamine biosynthesis adenylyltransferase